MQVDVAVSPSDAPHALALSAQGVVWTWGHVFFQNTGPSLVSLAEKSLSPKRARSTQRETPRLSLSLSDQASSGQLGLAHPSGLALFEPPRRPLHSRVLLEIRGIVFWRENAPRHSTR